jgi:hypothetical protein
MFYVSNLRRLGSLAFAAFHRVVAMTRYHVRYLASLRDHGLYAFHKNCRQNKSLRARAHRRPRCAAFLWRAWRLAVARSQALSKLRKRSDADFLQHEGGAFFREWGGVVRSEKFLSVFRRRMGFLIWRRYVEGARYMREEMVPPPPRLNRPASMDQPFPNPPPQIRDRALQQIADRAARKARLRLLAAAAKKWAALARCIAGGRAHLLVVVDAIVARRALEGWGRVALRRGAARSLREVVRRREMAGISRAFFATTSARVNFRKVLRQRAIKLTKRSSGAAPTHVAAALVFAVATPPVGRLAGPALWALRRMRAFAHSSRVVRRVLYSLTTTMSVSLRQKVFNLWRKEVETSRDHRHRSAHHKSAKASRAKSRALARWREATVAARFDRRLKALYFSAWSENAQAIIRRRTNAARAVALSRRLRLGGALRGWRVLARGAAMKEALFARASAATSLGTARTHFNKWVELTDAALVARDEAEALADLNFKVASQRRALRGFRAGAGAARAARTGAEEKLRGIVRAAHKSARMDSRLRAVAFWEVGRKGAALGGALEGRMVTRAVGALKKFCLLTQARRATKVAALGVFAEKLTRKSLFKWWAAVSASNWARRQVCAVVEVFSHPSRAGHGKRAFQSQTRPCLMGTSRGSQSRSGRQGRVAAPP